HAGPSCASGTCAIDTCTADADCDSATDLKCHAGRCCEKAWYDTNLEQEDGCECHVPEDPGPFCADAKNLGYLTEDFDSVTYSGALPYEGDVNTLRFSTDEHGWFSPHVIRVVFSSTDPTLSACVQVREGGDCPTNQDATRCGGYLTFEDENSTFLVKITRQSGAAPTCIPYTVAVSHH
ncbi:MAG: hypothetical protein HY901_09655, partial [Deltaproteobacteria bacterium]|nr:hypothetical protein [Deltaproteobacteria bacterium]